MKSSVRECSGALGKFYYFGHEFGSDSFSVDGIEQGWPARQASGAAF